ncbi:MAG: UPF0182 family protein [Acidimicrobiales bacterium]|nr:UPF0182 family protein [Acidimicrobiales bacterium]
MRPPSDMAASARPARRPHLRRRRWIIALVILLIILGASLRTFAVFYTDALWFSSVNLHGVWLTLFEVKLGLLVAFSLIFAAMLTASLLVAERLAPKGPAIDAEDEFVKRYREIIGPYARWLRVVVIVALSLIVGSQAVGQWQNWLLYRNATSFHMTDPQFHRDVSYYVFTLPFQQFLVHWALVALVVVLVVTVVSHYLNGGIRLQGPRPRVRPAVKAHISVIFGLVALVKAVGYYLARFGLDLSGNGYVQGAGYTDVHARLPALELLILVSLAAAALLIYNIRRQGWALPILGVGLWFLVALFAGTIYPAVVQGLRVTPSQNSLERPYIQRNIQATRTAMGIGNVVSVPYTATPSPSGNQVSAAYGGTLANARLWDPTQTGPTYQREQQFRTFYSFNTLAIDRYKINGQETPAIVGVREINQSALPAQSQSWVNTTLQYTHGYGMIVSPANVSTTSGIPQFDIGSVPPVSTNGLPNISQPAVYFGLDNTGYVVANSKQPEIDYQLSNGSNVETHYSGDGGVQLSSLFKQAMFALRFGSLNLLISDQITPQSRIMFDRGVQDRVAKAAPFLNLDADPYPVLVDGQIEWVQDAYTTSDNYPYAQNADSTVVAPGSGLSGTFNYVRNSVKVVINAYTGKMTFYVQDPNDPIIQTWEKAFPSMFTPASRMNPELRAHLRYPEDIFAVQATMFGRYHITNANSFYNAADAWTLSPSPGSGSPSQAVSTTFTTNAQGQLVSTGQLVRMSPLYQELQQPNQTGQSFSLLDAFVPVSNQSQIQTMSGFMIAGCDPGQYGKLTMYVTPRDNPPKGPALVAAQIDATKNVSSTITLLNTQGSTALLGNLLMLPVANSLLYIQPLYVASSRNAVPTLQQVIAAFGNGQPGIGQDLGAALTQVFGQTVSVAQGTNTGTGTISPQVRQLLAAAQQQYQQAQAALSAGNLGAYQNDINGLEADLTQIAQLTGVPVTSTTTTTTTTPGATG